MVHALAPVQRRVLERFARSRMLLALDFDGTLAPIVADPERTEMCLSTRRLLRQVARRYPCVVISGGARVDLLRRVLGLGMLEVIGNHGGEPREATRTVPEVWRWISLLQGDLAALPGVKIEDKGLKGERRATPQKDLKALP